MRAHLTLALWLTVLTGCASRDEGPQTDAEVFAQHDFGALNFKALIRWLCLGSWSLRPWCLMIRKVAKSARRISRRAFRCLIFPRKVDGVKPLCIRPRRG